MEAPDTGKKEHDGKEETKQHNHSHHNHHNHREEHVGGRKIDLVNYVVGLGAMATPGAFLEKRYLALTGRKYDKMEGLIGPEQIAKERKQEEEGGEKNTGVIYEF